MQQNDDEDDDEDWGEDLSADAVNKRMLELTDAAKGMTMSEDMEKPLAERVNLFYEFVKVMRMFVPSPNCNKLKGGSREKVGWCCICCKHKFV